MTPRSNGSDLKLTFQQEKLEPDRTRVSVLKDDKLTLTQAVNYQKLGTVHAGKPTILADGTNVNSKLSSPKEMLHVDIAEEPSENEKSCKMLMK